MDHTFLFQTFEDAGQVIGRLGNKRFFMVRIKAKEIMVALENDGCYVVDLTKPTFATDLMGAGFDLFTAPAVAHVIEEYREWLGRANDGGAVLRLTEN